MSQFDFRQLREELVARETAADFEEIAILGLDSFVLVIGNECRNDACRLSAFIVVDPLSSSR
jgi:hypothetical protein